MIPGNRLLLLFFLFVSDSPVIPHGIYDSHIVDPTLCHTLRKNIWYRVQKKKKKEKNPIHISVFKVWGSFQKTHMINDLVTSQMHRIFASAVAGSTADTIDYYLKATLRCFFFFLILSFFLSVGCFHWTSWRVWKRSLVGTTNCYIWKYCGVGREAVVAIRWNHDFLSELWTIKEFSVEN